MPDLFERMLASRKGLSPRARPKVEQEGGCGVVGFASTVPAGGRHILEPSVRMHNRGNGKGGGIAAAGLVPEQMGVDAATLRDDYLLQVALLDPKAEGEVERELIRRDFRVDHKARLEPARDHRELGLEVRPPDVVRYFVRAEESSLDRFAADNRLKDAPRRAVEDELVFRNSFELNKRFYAALGEKRAFVLSHARDLMIIKIVGYAEEAVRYYGLDDMKARIWIAHQRYPTKGRVWHPAGSHPFIGLNEALVHNGDFANYHGVAEYLAQHGCAPLFLTDTEVAAILFDLWSRTYGYSLEHVIEAMAPTTELDFERLPEAKRKVYRALQRMHLHRSPDGPWFFIVARTETDKDTHRLLGITDTSMLRPQVFALQEGEVSIGLVASERQAIDATLRSLSEEDKRFRPVADKYWNARGGSHTDGGAFAFNLKRSNGRTVLECADKFGRRITTGAGEWRYDAEANPVAPPNAKRLEAALEKSIRGGEGVEPAFAAAAAEIPKWRFIELRWLLAAIRKRAPGSVENAVELLALLNDRPLDWGGMRRSAAVELVRNAIDELLGGVPALEEDGTGGLRRIDRESRGDLRAPKPGETALVIDARDFDPEGKDSEARLTAEAHELGWKRFIVHGLRGQRFTGCGLGPGAEGVRIDVFGSSGDYLASGADGPEIVVHGAGQDQLGQIMKSGRLVVHGDVGQTFLYGAKGGECYVLGNAAGRPLINAVGKPRVVINGTCLDFLAESFMAGDPLNGGGFVVLNGVELDGEGRVREQASPYPGSNLFSLASGGAIYARDPRRKLVDAQLNGGEFAELADADWDLIRPYLEENERLFGIKVDELLTVDGSRREPKEVYRKVQAVQLAVLAASH